MVLYVIMATIIMILLMNKFIIVDDCNLSEKYANY